MSDLNWYAQQLHVLNEGLWHLSAATRDVTAFEDDLRQVWNDSATRDLRGRLLHPLHEEHDAACTALRQKSAALGAMQDRLIKTQTHCQQVATLSDLIAVRRHEINLDMDRAHHERDWADQLTNQVIDATDQILQLIRNADQTLP